MKTWKTIPLLLILAAAVSSCLAPAQKVMNSSNQKVKVELLFEIDGCKVYRFYDGPTNSAPRYFTKCQNGSSSVGWLENCGKNCVYYAENVTTYENVSLGDSVKRGE